ASAAEEVEPGGSGRRCRGPNPVHLFPLTLLDVRPESGAAHLRHRSRRGPASGGGIASPALRERRPGRAPDVRELRDNRQGRRRDPASLADPERARSPPKAARVQSPGEEVRPAPAGTRSKPAWPMVLAPESSPAYIP